MPTSHRIRQDPVTLTNPKPLSISTSLAIRSSLLDLKSGDFVVVSGEFVDKNLDGIDDEIRVDAIESVGLTQLIGSWRNSNWDVVRFEDFNSLSLYRPKSRSGALPGAHADLAKLKDLSYTLAPEKGASYSIFLAEKNSLSVPAPVYVGHLDVKADSLQLEIFDPKTGHSSEVLFLSPVRD